jgi:hypothetical protein
MHAKTSIDLGLSVQIQNAGMPAPWIEHANGRLSKQDRPFCSKAGTLSRYSTRLPVANSKSLRLTFYPHSPPRISNSQRQSQVIETWASYLAKGGYYPQTEGSDIVLGQSSYQHHSQDQSVQLAAATALHGPNSVSPPPTSASEAASQAMQAALGPTTRRPSSNSVPLAPEEQAQVAAERFERENPAVSSQRFERENPAVSSQRFERENPAVSSESPALVTVDGHVEASAGDDRGEGQETTSARVIESNAESFRKSDDDIDSGH